MKPQEAEIVGEISKLQCMVSELKMGFSSALMELSQIQHGDSYLREELEENRRSCKKKALRMETLVEALREELGVMQCQILQLYSNKQRPLQDAKSSTLKQRKSADTAESTRERSHCNDCNDCSSAPPAGPSRGKLLLHCFLQGLKAGLSEGTDARHQVAMQLLHSEWEYVSTLNQLYDKYKAPPVHHMTLEPYQTYLKFVEQLLQRHLLFRNTLQERLSAEHWKSLVGDILVQLIGQNDASFSDMYIGYTSTLASFLSLEFNRLNQSDDSEKTQSVQVEREEMKLLSLLLAPVTRIHSYLSHIQNLLQWTGKEHPDCSLLLGAERALRALLARCHVILEEDVRWGEEEGPGRSSDAPPGGCSAKRFRRNQQSREGQQGSAAQREDQDGVALANGVDGCHSVRVECWSCSPVRRRADPGRDPGECGHGCCSLLTPEAAGWGDNSDSGQGTFSQRTDGAAPARSKPGRADCDTDPDDTSAFDYSSVTSGSPEGTLRREVTASGEEEDEEEEDDEEEEEDSQEPVLLKPSLQQQREATRERTVCLRWQIPRLTPHPPLRGEDGPAPCLVSSYGKRLVSVRTGSPPLHPKSAFRPIWDHPSTQVDSSPEKDGRQGFVPVQAASSSSSTRQSCYTHHPSRDSGLRVSQQRGSRAPAASIGGLWEDSEDSEGPCSTV
ncbi:uncharacterized protein LOC142886315 isoform X2 [Nelusetta ayraudi]|uniref:uncharacterized protein LOC142886315 isoform X2 n=1 Tax=Nelusetta ayraudi TaxID=303726 RepID=UPI003F713C53